MRPEADGVGPRQSLPPETEEGLWRYASALPPAWRRRLERLREPRMKWLRMPLGAGFLLGGLLFVLPVFGLWMFPVGIMLLAEDIPAARRASHRLAGAIEQWRASAFVRRAGERLDGVLRPRRPAAHPVPLRATRLDWQGSLRS